ncbi:MAG: hypothetical protein A2W31_05145 [Planctomycetes bacterium RBG_16_64_10]|nr:MAG: hypothetical protein A2W31_05145 [Planctomycetes bacterium RBG_16_64_10]
MTFTIENLRLYSLANVRSGRGKARMGHWAKRAAIAKVQRQLAMLTTNAALHKAAFAWQMDNKLRITITRVGKRPLDSDNLAISAKHVRDGIADELGVDDGDKRLVWVYEQRGGEYGVEVEIVELAAAGAVDAGRAQGQATKTTSCDTSSGAVARR